MRHNYVGTVLYCSIPHMQGHFVSKVYVTGVLSTSDQFSNEYEVISYEADVSTLYYYYPCTMCKERKVYKSDP